MNVIDSNFNIIFPPIPNIREHIFNLENELSLFFPKPFNLIPLPNEAPAEIPRITATSHHGFSNLAISLNSAQFVTNFSDDYSRDWSKCIDYIYTHVGHIYSILKPKFNGKPSYCGLTVNFVHKVEDGDAISLILKNFIKSNSSHPPYDLLVKQTYVIEDEYYVNIQIHNQRLDKNQSIPIGHLSEFEHRDLIGISLDINDRYGFNYTPSYYSGDEKIASVFRLTNKIVSEKLEKFVTEGVLEI
jgi:hypothetical protein